MSLAVTRVPLVPFQFLYRVPLLGVPKLMVLALSRASSALKKVLAWKVTPELVEVMFTVTFWTVWPKVTSP